MNACEARRLACGDVGALKKAGVCGREESACGVRALGAVRVRVLRVLRFVAGQGGGGASSAARRK